MRREMTWDECDVEHSDMFTLSPIRILEAREARLIHLIQHPRGWYIIQEIRRRLFKLYMEL